MKNRNLQIDVLGLMDEAGEFMSCILIVDGRSCKIFMSKSNYEALKYDGVFIRDGKEKDSANVINTTRVFREVINPENLGI